MFSSPRKAVATPMIASSRQADPPCSPMLHPFISGSLSKSLGLNSPFSLTALSTSLTSVCVSPPFSNGAGLLGRSFEDRPKLEEQFFKNFVCCGLDLLDLHGLLEHFEESHVTFENDDSAANVWPLMKSSAVNIVGNGNIDALTKGNGTPATITASPMFFSTASRNETSGRFREQFPSQPPSDVDMSDDDGMDFEMEIDDDSTAQTTVSSPVSGFSLADGSQKRSFSVAMNTNSLRASLPNMTISSYRKFDRNLSLASSTRFPTTARHLFGHSAYSTDASLSGSQSADDDTESRSVAPSLLYSAAGSEVSDADASDVLPLATKAGQTSPNGRTFTGGVEKPFQCAVPGCDKRYKQQNGLKYHRLHGHCNQNNFTKLKLAQPDQKPESGKPYVCHVESCGKKYKNMNGLRYHYQHSGAHGALGLKLLSTAAHPPPQFPPGHRKAIAVPTDSAMSSRAPSPLRVI